MANSTSVYNCSHRVLWSRFAVDGQSPTGGSESTSEVDARHHLAHHDARQSLTKRTRQQRLQCITGVVAVDSDGVAVVQVSTAQVPQISDSNSIRRDRSVSEVSSATASYVRQREGYSVPSSCLLFGF